MVQWQLAWWASLGMHVDPKRRRVGGGPFEGQTYGPYLDLHLLFVIVSLGWRPYLTGELQNISGVARGGYSVPTDDDLVVDRIDWSYRTFVEVLLILLLVLNIYGTYWRIRRGGWTP